jgi:hypothetical protein
MKMGDHEKMNDEVQRANLAEVGSGHLISDLGGRPPTSEEVYGTVEPSPQEDAYFENLNAAAESIGRPDLEGVIEHLAVDRLRGEEFTPRLITAMGQMQAAHVSGEDINSSKFRSLESEGDTAAKEALAEKGRAGAGFGQSRQPVAPSRVRTEEVDVLSTETIMRPQGAEMVQTALAGLRKRRSTEEQGRPEMTRRHDDQPPKQDRGHGIGR